MTDYRDFYRQLRTDWLQLRSYLFDATTRLPALPAVLDVVRRRLEEGEPLGLIYVDPSGGGSLEASCGWEAYDALIRETAQLLRRFQRQHLERHDTVALNSVRGDEFLIFAGLEGHPAERLDGLHGELRALLQRELTIRHEGQAHPLELLVSSALALEPMPEVRIERAIYGTLRRARQLGQRQTQQLQVDRLRALERMLAEGDVLIRFQPILDLASARVHGFEALGSPTSADSFDNAETLFTFAEQSERIGELERLCRRQAVRRAAPLVERYPGAKLFLNCSPHAFDDPELVADLVEGALVAGCPPGDLVVEVTERVAITEWQPFQQVLSDLRYAGLGVAIDDMGSGYSSLHAVAEIEPDYLKIDGSLVQEVHRSPIKRDLLESLSTLASKIGARSIAEGIEHPPELTALRNLGVDYGQGYLFAAPAPPDQLRLG